MSLSLVLKGGGSFKGLSFGAEVAAAGEVVFTTGMVGYPESLTDPSYAGQILVCAFPLIGNYGVPNKNKWESGKIQVAGLIVSSYIDTPSHQDSIMTLGAWLTKERVPAMEIKDTRFLVKKLRTQGVMLGAITTHKRPSWYDPNDANMVALVSTARLRCYGRGTKTVALIDCGVKRNIIRELTARGVRVVVVPWDYDVNRARWHFDGVVISNGPGDPVQVAQTITVVRELLRNEVPTFGICLGSQILALAAGGDTYKLKFGHRGQNQPVNLCGTPTCYMTTQNHGFAVKTVPRGFRPWFVNGNDGTNEGILHRRKPFMAVQFHPEAHPGPFDTGWLFDYFLERVI